MIDFDTILSRKQTEYTYDSAGYNDLIKVKRYGDEEYSVSYEYDSTYHLPTKQTQKQNADTTLRSISTLTADKKAVAEKKLTANNATQRKRQYSYDSSGNVISEKRFTGENSWNDFMEIQYSYDGANLTGITVDGVKNSDGALISAADGSAAGEVTYAYDYDYFGNIISETDGNGNTYTYAYDGLNRPVLLTNPENGTIGISYHTAILDSYTQLKLKSRKPTHPAFCFFAYSYSTTSIQFIRNSRSFGFCLTSWEAATMGIHFCTYWRAVLVLSQNSFKY